MCLGSQGTEEILKSTLILAKQRGPLVLHVYIFGNRIGDFCIPSPDNELHFFRTFEKVCCLIRNMQEIYGDNKHRE